MVMRFDLEGASPAVANVDDACVLAGPLKHALTARRQAFQVNTRGFIGAVLAPHHAENAELGERRLAVAEKLLDFLVFIRRQAVLPEGLRGECRGQGSRHGRASIVAFWDTQV